ncbi:MAG: hypothetical protein P1V36_00580 [Planctomycetota bacterium]|nr:hypothetical protein [Planctomycetota bacterium]
MNRRLWNLALGLAVASLLTGCKTSVPTTMNTHVGESQTMVGRMAPHRESQTFTFEGVESSLLDFTVQAGDASVAAPTIAVMDPDGERLPVETAVGAQKGSATVSVSGLVLSKTGNYQVVATPSNTCGELCYSFRHRLRYPPPAPRKTQLSACKPAPLYFSAPRGGFVAVTVTRDPGQEFIPDIVAVKDPWGGPALDKSQVPCGCNPPRVSRSCNNSMILTFTAPKPGIYTVMAAAKPGAEGTGTISVQVRKPKGAERYVYHGGARATAYGNPGRVAPTPAAAPCSPPTVGAPRGRASIPPPPPPPSTASRIQGAQPPIEAPIARR